MRFIKVQERDNWGTLTYVIGERTLSAGQEVMVQWPDGTEAEYTLKARKHYSAVSDMGHNYTVGTNKLVIEVEINGLLVDVLISRLKVGVPT